MMQHPINLITDVMLERSRAGVRTSRLVLTGLALTMCMILTATHSRILLDGNEQEHASTSARAEMALELDKTVRSLESQQLELKRFMDDYHAVALPLDATRIIATLVDSLPASVTLTEFDLRYDAGSRQQDPSDPGTRYLSGSMAGIAASDADVAALVHGLGLREPFESVQLEYSRSQVIRDLPAREFSLTFMIDLTGRFQVTDMNNVALEVQP